MKKALILIAIILTIVAIAIPCRFTSPYSTDSVQFAEHKWGNWSEPKKDKYKDQYQQVRSCEICGLAQSRLTWGSTSNIGCKEMR